MNNDVVVSIPTEERELAELLTRETTLAATPLSGAGMDGGSEYLLLLIPLAPLTIKALVDLLRAHWDRAKHVRFEIDGMSISGSSLDEIAAFLDRHTDRGDGKQ